MQILSRWRRRIAKKYRVIYKRGPSTLAAIFLVVAGLSGTLLLLATGYPLGQYVYYSLLPDTSRALASGIGETARSAESTSPSGTPTQVVTNETQPPRDSSLPEGHYLSIPSIGVDTVVWEAREDEYEEALRRGVWRVPDFGTPGEGGKPIILAAHRFGYLEWSQEYRAQNSFFNLPKLASGDEIEMMWDQRRYKYRVEQVVEGSEIGDYSADLILYTCKFLVSPVRIFVYAKRI